MNNRASLLIALLLLNAGIANAGAFVQAWTMTGRFSPTVPTPSYWGDMDGDGHPELVTNASVGGYWVVQVLDAVTGSIRFTSPVQIANGTDIYRFTVFMVDVDGDARMDALCSNGAGNTTFLIKWSETAGVEATPSRGQPAGALQVRGNPAFGNLEFDIAPTVAGGVELEVIDVLGRRVLSESVVSLAQPLARSRTLSLRDGTGRAISPGTYFLVLRQNGVQLDSVKFALIQ